MGWRMGAAAAEATQSGDKSVGRAVVGRAVWRRVGLASDLGGSDQEDGSTERDEGGRQEEGFLTSPSVACSSHVYRSGPSESAAPAMTSGQWPEFDGLRALLGSNCPESPHFGRTWPVSTRVGQSPAEFESDFGQIWPESAEIRETLVGLCRCLPRLANMGEGLPMSPQIGRFRAEFAAGRHMDITRLSCDSSWRAFVTFGLPRGAVHATQPGGVFATAVLERSWLAVLAMQGVPRCDEHAITRLHVWGSSCRLACATGEIFWCN